MRLEVKLSGEKIEQTADGISKSSKSKDGSALMSKFATVNDGVCSFGLDEKAITASGGSGLAKVLSAFVEVDK